MVSRRYRVHDLLGRGGMAEVFLATDTVTDEHVAIKVMRGVEPAKARRFQSEIEILALLDHPGLVRLRDSGSHEGVPYLVLDLAEGPSLADELARGPIGVDRALTVGQHVADALAHAHELGIVHRDVKPSNILFDSTGRARLADFGIAQVAGATTRTRTGVVVGSAPYIAPEQLKGRQASPAADVYALGLVVIECVTGGPCYAGTQVEATVARLHRPPRIPADLPQWLREVLCAMTAEEPARRPPASSTAEAVERRSAEPVIAVTGPIELRPDEEPPEDAPAPSPELPPPPPPGGLWSRLRTRSGVPAMVAVSLLAMCAGALLAWTLRGGMIPANRPPPSREVRSTAVPTTTRAPITVAPPTTPPPTQPPPTEPPPPPEPRRTRAPQPPPTPVPPPPTLPPPPPPTVPPPPPVTVVAQAAPTTIAPSTTVPPPPTTVPVPTTITDRRKDGGPGAQPRKKPRPGHRLGDD